LRPSSFHDTPEHQVPDLEKGTSMAPRRCTETNTARSRPAPLPLLGRVGAAIVLAGLGLLAAAAIGLSGPASAQSPTTTLVGGGPSSPSPKNVWIALGGNPLSVALTRARKYVACVRQNGISNLPKPKSSGGQVWLTLPAGLNRDAPRVKAAQRACRKLLPQATTTRSGPGAGLTTTRP
jgi:hypothetical protein